MKVVQILHNGEPVKSGMGKNGKPWEMVEVELDSGDTCTLFGPIKLGTEVETYDHETYGLQYRVKRASLEKLEKQLEDLTKMVKWLVKDAQANNQPAPVKEPEPEIKMAAPPDVASEDPDDLDGLFND